MKRKIGELILIIFFYLLQVTLGRVIAIGGIKPNLLIILPVLFGFLHGKNEGMYCMVFLPDFFMILFFSGLFGFTSLVFVYIGYCSGIFLSEIRRNRNVDSSWLITGRRFLFRFSVLCR